MKIALALDTTALRNLSVQAQAVNILLKYGTSPQVWYDPSDLSTLYQDSAGSTPVTAVEQPVGLMLDKSKGLVLGSEVITAAANRDFSSDTGFWVKTAGVSIGGGTLNFVNATSTGGAYNNSVLTVGKTYLITLDILSVSAGAVAIMNNSVKYGSKSTAGKLSVIVTAASGQLLIYCDGNLTATVDNISVKELPGLHATQATALSRPVLSSRYNLLLNTETLSTQNVTTVAVSYTLSFTGTGTITLSGTSTAGPLVGTGASNRVSLTFTPTAGTLTLTVSGSVTQAQLITTNSFTSNTYQRVTTATDYDADFTKFPPYLRCDGVDDGMATASIDFTSTDKMTIFTGVCKQSDASATILYELTANYATSNGTFAVFAPGSGGNPDISFASRGTATSARSSTATPAGTNYVLTHVSDIAADRLAPRVNGVALTPSVADQGTGTFGNYPLYLFRRGGTTLPFNGRFYGLTIIGAAISDSETSVLERFTATKTGVTL